jgi:hypothetical protein
LDGASMLKLSGAWLCGLSSVPQGSGLSRLRSSADYSTIVHKRKLVLELTQRGFLTNHPSRWLALYGYLQFSREEKFVAPLIATPNGEVCK